MKINRPLSPNNDIEIFPALKEQEPILANLLELYSHDFSEFIDLHLDAEGRYGYEHLHLYWKESTRHPFLVKVSGHFAGFAFVCKGSKVSNDKDVWDMTEFFILRRYRRSGIGMKVAHEVWKQFLGKWEVRVIDQHQSAKAFWKTAIERFVNKEVDPYLFNKDDTNEHVFSFVSNRV